MVSVKDDTVDFDKLEKELHNAVEADARYNRENDAKFRAVNQRVATYEEFRDIVLASHIKPLEKDDRLDKIERFTHPWNVHGKKSTGGDCNSQMEQKKTSPKIPKNGHELSRDWKRQCKNLEEKYSYLLRIGARNLKEIFKAEISFGLLGEILCSLNKEFKDENGPEVLDIIQTLTKINRFNLSVQFLSKEENQECSELLRKLQSCKLLSEDSYALLLKEYGVCQE